MESYGDVSWEPLLGDPGDLSDCELASCELVRAVPGGSYLIDVLVSPSSVITELCDVFPCRSDSEFVEPQSFLFLQEACTLLYRYAGRDEVCWLNCDNASAFFFFEEG